jgi:hypothetical protein
MKTLLILTILGFTQPSAEWSSDKMIAEAKLLAEKHNGDVKVVTGKLIEWLYNETNSIEVLSPEEISLLKNTAQIQCGAATAKKMARVHLQRNLKTYSQVPGKAWHDNVRLNVTYANGQTIIYTVRAYGYRDPSNPNVFVYDLNEQTPDLQRIVRGMFPAKSTAPPQYYYQPQQYYLMPRVRSIRRGSTVCGPTGCYTY